MDKEKIRKCFIDELGIPNNFQKLEEYLDFCNVNKNLYFDYYEKHHVLPRCLFEKYIKDDWNIVALSYENHVLSHFLLVEAYHRRSFTRCLNFLKNKTEDEIKKLKKILSEISKKQWKDLSPEEYETKCFMQAERMKLYLSSGSEFIEKVCKGVQEYYKNNPQRRLEISKWSIERWKNMTEEEYEKCIKNMKSSFTEERKRHLSEISKERHKDPNFKKKIKSIMSIVNKDPEKRKNAGDKIRKKWQEDESYRENAIKSRIGLLWWNNGIIEIKNKESPGDNWVRGRCNKNLGRKKNETK